MPVPTFTMRQLLEAGVHFGHRTSRWNPKMRQYIFGVRNGVHIIDLQQTEPMLNTALKALRDIVANGGRVLFVGTKRQAGQKIKETAQRCGQYYVNHRWLGGMLTNWNTISKSINRLRELEDILSGETSGYKKKEILMLTRERDKLELSIGGIKEMGGRPDVLFIIDTNNEDIAIKEANNLGIPVIAVIDTNSTPEGVDYPVPGNDDAIRAIDLYCNLAAETVLDGLQAELAGVKTKDAGEAEDIQEALPEENAESSAADAKKETKAKSKKEDKADDSEESSATTEPEQAADSAEAAEEVKKAASA